MKKVLVLLYLILTHLNPVPNQNIQHSLDDKDIDKAIAAEMNPKSEYPT
jgi:hypothetical protein